MNRGGLNLSANWTIRHILNWTRNYFKQAGITQPRLEAEILLAHCLGADRLYLYLNPDKPLSSSERAVYRDLVKQRHGGTPLQHLTREVLFYGLRFKVKKQVLIPRPETEELVDQALHAGKVEQSKRCLDLGTGSGVIAVCLAKYLASSTVTAVDVSNGALELAKENAALNDVENKIDFVRSDWFSDVDGEFDLIVSNPPYIDEAGLDDLPSEVHDHEPENALNGGNSGTEQIENLLSCLLPHATANALVLLEIGDSQAQRVQVLASKAGLIDIRVEHDLADKERFVIGRCP